MRYIKCHECGRKFDLINETDAQEWTYGHDCEEQPVFRLGKLREDDE
jgi:hypothetical protein